jgi:hypothetical protein
VIDAGSDPSPATAIQKPTFAGTQSAIVPASPIASAVWDTATALTRPFASDVYLPCDLDGVIDLDAKLKRLITEQVLPC